MIIVELAHVVCEHDIDFTFQVVALGYCGDGMINL